MLSCQYGGKEDAGSGFKLKISHLDYATWNLSVRGMTVNVMSSEG